MSPKTPAVVCVEKGKKEITVLNWGDPAVFGFDNKGAVLLNGMHVTTYHAGFTFDGFVRVCPKTHAVEIRFAYKSLTSDWCKTASSALNEVNKKMNNAAHKSVTSGRLVLGIGYLLFQQRLKTVFPQLQNVVAPSVLLSRVASQQQRRPGTRKRRAAVEMPLSPLEEEEQPSTPPPSVVRQIPSFHHHPNDCARQVSQSSSSCMITPSSKRPRTDSFNSYSFVCELMKDGKEADLIAEWAEELCCISPAPLQVERSCSGQVIKKLPSPKAAETTSSSPPTSKDQQQEDSTTCFFNVVDVDFDEMFQHCDY